MNGIYFNIIVDQQLIITLTLRNSENKNTKGFIRSILQEI